MYLRKKAGINEKENSKVNYCYTVLLAIPIPKLHKLASWVSEITFLEYVISVWFFQFYQYLCVILACMHKIPDPSSPVNNRMGKA